VSLTQLSVDERTVFFINLYNLMFMHGLVEYGIPRSNTVAGVPTKPVRFQRSLGYVVSQLFWSLLDVKYGVLRHHMTTPTPRVHMHPGNLPLLISLPVFDSLLMVHLVCPTGLSPLFAPVFSAHDPRRAYTTVQPDPRIVFTLCSGSKSSPLLRIYTPQNLDEQLTAATRVCGRS